MFINNALVTIYNAFKAVYMKSCSYRQCWGNLILKVMRYNIALLPKKVTDYVT